MYTEPYTMIFMVYAMFILVYRSIYLYYCIYTMIFICHLGIYWYVIIAGFRAARLDAQ